MPMPILQPRVEPTLGRDILILHAIDKPALLRQLFWYVSKLPAHIVSYEKILGHLQGKGNSATLVHYAQLLQLAHVVVPLSRFSIQVHRTKRSQPKWLIPNPALVDVSIRTQGLQGFVFENLVGAHLLNVTYGSSRHGVHYWRDGDHEVDFILTTDNQPVLAIEVKSGRIKKSPPLKQLQEQGISCPVIIVGQKNIEAFLMTTEVTEILRL